MTRNACLSHDVPPVAAAVAALFAATLAAVAPPALAQTPSVAEAPKALAVSPQRAIVDPTVPPPGFGKRGAGSGEGTDVAAPAPVPNRLQMIVRGPGETRMAVINGETLRVGDRVRHDGGEARVVRITDGSVTLDRSGTRHTLELVPGANAAVRCAAGTETNGRSAPQARCQPLPGDG